MKQKLLSVIVLIGSFSLLPSAMVQANGWEDNWKKKAVELSKEDYVINATKDLIPAFSKFREENGLDSVESLKEGLVNFYTNEFAKEYFKHTGEEIADLKPLIDPLDDDSIALQHYYIVANPNPLESKQLLDQADDKSSWSQLHGKYHPKLHSYLKKAELHDIFLVDLDSGDIVYSVYKEIDFTTSVSEGPYADVFKEAYQQIKDADSSDFVSTFFNIYTPFYGEIAYFFMTPVYNGEEKIGALMIEVPL